MLASTPKSSSSHFQKSTPIFSTFFFPHRCFLTNISYLPNFGITKLLAQEVPGLFWLVMSGSTAFSCLVLVTKVTKVVCYVAFKKPPYRLYWWWTISGYSFARVTVSMCILAKWMVWMIGRMIHWRDWPQSWMRIPNYIWKMLFILWPSVTFETRWVYHTYMVPVDI